MLEERLDGYEVTAVPDVARGDSGPLRLVWVRPRSAFAVAGAGGGAGDGLAGEAAGATAALTPLTLLDAYRVNWVPIAS